ncbi:flavin reductase family protein [Microbacterium sp. GXF7504]
MSVSAETMRSVMGTFPSGVTVVTTAIEGSLTGFTCQSFMSVSLDPPLVLISVMNTSTTYPSIRESGRFCVNVLAEHQGEDSTRFARKGVDRWATTRWRPTANGNPVLEEAAAWVDCELWAEHEAGDHLLVVGRTVELGKTDAATRPLLFHQGRYRVLAHE